MMAVWYSVVMQHGEAREIKMTMRGRWLVVFGGGPPLWNCLRRLTFHVYVFTAKGIATIYVKS